LISDLPKEFPLSSLQSIDLGMAEARDDELLIQCVTKLPLFNEITSGKKDIIHGYRGTGKTSIVRLFSEGVLNFDGDSGYKSLVLVIDEELEYRSIRDHLNKHVENGTEPALLLRIVWDLLICFRSMKFLQQYIGDTDSTLRENIKRIEELFGVRKSKASFLELMLTQKKKVGVKLDSNLPSIVDMYAGFEPNTTSDEKEELSVLLLSEYMRYLNKLLHEKKLSLYILLDRLDDFVVQEDYETQRMLLQQLLACQADVRTRYQKRMKVLTFLRTDLFARIDQQPLGPDKVAAKSLEIKWSPSDIRRFMAKRIALNLLKILDRKALTIVDLDQNKYWVSKEEIGKLEETKTTLANFNVTSRRDWEELIWLLNIFVKRARNDTRTYSFDDAQNEAFITSLFPKATKGYAE
jgi:hypothetical protein